MNIRQAVKKDAPSLISFQKEMALESEGLLLDEEVLTRGVMAVINDPHKGKYWVAELNQEIIASLLIIKEWSDWRDGAVLWIHSVYVIQKQRRKGVFKKMYQKIKEQVLSDSSLVGIRLYVDKKNSSAIATYQKVGMSDEHYSLYEWLKD